MTRTSLNTKITTTGQDVHPSPDVPLYPKDLMMTPGVQMRMMGRRSLRLSF